MKTSLFKKIIELKMVGSVLDIYLTGVLNVRSCQKVNDVCKSQISITISSTVICCLTCDNNFNVFSKAEKNITSVKLSSYVKDASIKYYNEIIKNVSFKLKTTTV